MSSLQLDRFLLDVVGDDESDNSDPVDPTSQVQLQLQLRGVPRTGNRSLCGHGSPLIPLCLAIPYVIRFAQCLRMYAARPHAQRAQLFNALKYLTALPVITLSSVKYHVAAEAWTTLYRPLWILAAVLNSVYCVFWDLQMDWVRRSATCAHVPRVHKAQIDAPRAPTPCDLKQWRVFPLALG